ncbi:MAG: DUF4143 domain-containing protein, partial [Planctomycetes bacterium]|nr:DUF4143 domain-containing protein [Planctomycetota bacterium]
LLGIRSASDLMGHPKLGASWEGFALELVMRSVRERDAYFWAVHSGPELDLLVVSGARRVGFEFKWADAPGLTPSMQTALADLKLDRLYVVYPGTLAYALENRVEVAPIQELDRILDASSVRRTPSGG